MSTPGFPLPMELVIMVIEDRVDYDRLNHQSLNDSERQADKMDHEPNDQTRLAWISTTLEMQKDVCNIRLVCRQSKEAADRSFALVLGDRRFRWTELAFKDLDILVEINASQPTSRHSPLAVPCLLRG